MAAVSSSGSELGVGETDIGVDDLPGGLCSKLVNCLVTFLRSTRLALGVPFFVGEAKRLPKLSWGSLVASPQENASSKLGCEA